MHIAHLIGFYKRKTTECAERAYINMSKGRLLMIKSSSKLSLINKIEIKWKWNSINTFLL